MCKAKNLHFMCEVVYFSTFDLMELGPKDKSLGGCL
jgi:hypothetical protein